MSFIKKQFIEIIQWTESGPGVLAYRYPMQDMEIKNGAQLIVRETQIALFVNEGKLADIFGPGTHTLTTRTLPILTYLRNWDKAFESPFKSDVYFFSRREQIDQKWGTPEPITIRDKEFGVLRIRGNGIYSYRLADFNTFWTNISGTRDIYQTTDIEGQLRSIILTTISTLVAQSNVAFIDMAANQSDFSAKLKEAVAPEFKKFGFELTSFFVQSISLPAHLQEHLDKLSSMGMFKDIQQYARFQTAESIPIAAENSGGIAGAGAGLGAGVALGQMISSSLANPTPAGSSGNDPYSLSVID